jgi:hypothetical protein
VSRYELLDPEKQDLHHRFSAPPNGPTTHHRHVTRCRFRTASVNSSAMKASLISSVIHFRRIYIYSTSTGLKKGPSGLREYGQEFYSSGSSGGCMPSPTGSKARPPMPKRKAVPVGPTVVNWPVTGLSVYRLLLP